MWRDSYDAWKLSAPAGEEANVCVRCDVNIGRHSDHCTATEGCEFDADHCANCHDDIHEDNEVAA